MNILKFKAKLIYSNIKTRLILILTLVIGLAVCMVGIGMYVVAKQSLLEEYKVPHQQMLTFVRDDVDRKVAEINTTSIHAVLHPLTIDFIRYDNHQSIDTILGVVSLLDTLSQSSSTIESIYIYDTKRQHVVGSSPYGFHSSIETLGDTSWLPLLSLVEKDTNNLTFTKRMKGQGEVISLIRKITVDNQLSGFLVINLNPSKLFSQMRTSEPDVGTASRIIQDSNGEVLFSVGEVNKEILNPSRYFITKMTSTSTHWNYMYAVPQEQVLGKLKWIRTMAFLVSAITMLIGMIVIFQINRITFKPVERIIKMVQKHQTEAMDVDLIQLENFVVRLLTQHTFLHGSNKELKAKFLQDTVYGKLSRKEFDRKWRLLYSEWSSDLPVYAVIVSIDAYYKWVNGYKQDDQLVLKFAIGNIFEEVLGEGFRVQYEDLNQDRSVIIVQPLASDIELQVLYEKLQYGIEVTNKLLNISVSVGVGEPLYPIDGNLSIRYKQVEILLMDRLYASYKKLHVPEQALQYSEASGIGTKRETVYDILQGIRDGNTDYVRGTLEKIRIDWETIMAEPRFVFRWYTNLIKEMIKEFRNQTDGQFQEMMESMDSLQTLSFAELHGMASDEAEQLAEEVKRRKPTKHDNHLRKMIDYIQEHYPENIGVANVAEAAGISSSQANYIFKQETGSTIYDYITRVRIEKAEELLKNTNLKVTEISEKVGYASENSFIRNFRKIKGVTPGQYKG
ncbi:AraC family transcriptional regulator [Paenibacillus sp. WQ 127069]|uniref:AraC family transcriptional regulator n=1 Tax=Paenibacillus baimaensis TaxID=2982185 RepID=A0ABT2UB45_9BACL|nr:AraC family transcriptional regulator [Paenibacillus sp. WQ 127069]MCU6791865.1 AraC family transcriptional regulator [Paenibacillus sp. WQ 127069]